MSKPKIKITFTVDVQYEPDPNSYPEGSTVEQMLAIDLKNAEEDPFLMLDGATAWKTTGEIV